MKRFIFVLASIYIFSVSAYAIDECDTKYYEKLKRLNGITTEISAETKNRYKSGLERAYQLYKDGKKEQAEAIFEDLRKDKEFDSVFSTHDGN